MKLGRKNTKDNDIDDKAKEMVRKRGNVVGETLRVQDVIGFFIYDINPSYQDAKIEHAIARDRAGVRSVNWNIVIIMGILLMFGAIAYTMVSGTFTQSTCQNELAQCYVSRNYTSAQEFQQPSQTQPIHTPSPGIEIR